MEKVSLNNLNSNFNPIQAIVVYRHEDQFYLESHGIFGNGKEFLFSEGKPLTEDTLMKIFAGLTTKKNQTLTRVELLPKGILYNCQVPGKFNIIWYKMRHKRILHFSNMKDAEVMLPNLIFKWDGDNLWVFCFLGNKPPEPHTQLYRSPFMNTSDGKICLGNAKVNKNTNSLRELIRSCEHAFLDSKFTHDGMDQTHYRNELSWKSIVRTKVFPVKKLIKQGFSLNYLILNHGKEEN